MHLRSAYYVLARRRDWVGLSSTAPVLDLANGTLDLTAHFAATLAAESGLLEDVPEPASVWEPSEEVERQLWEAVRAGDAMLGMGLLDQDAVDEDAEFLAWNSPHFPHQLVA